jgi:hypothetical protein
MRRRYNREWRRRRSIAADETKAPTCPAGGNLFRTFDSSIFAVGASLSRFAMPFSRHRPSSLRHLTGLSGVWVWSADH